MLQREHSAILSTFIKQPFVFKIFVLSIFELPFYPGFTVVGKSHVLAQLLFQILEVGTADGKMERFSSLEGLRNVVKEMQYYAVIRQRISKK